MQHADYKFLSTVYRTPALAVLMMSVPPSKCTFSTPRKKIELLYMRRILLCHTFRSVPVSHSTDE